MNCFLFPFLADFFKIIVKPTAVVFVLPSHISLIFHRIQAIVPFFFIANLLEYNIFVEKKNHDHDHEYFYNPYLFLRFNTTKNSLHLNFLPLDLISIYN